MAQMDVLDNMRVAFHVKDYGWINDKLAEALQYPYDIAVFVGDAVVMASVEAGMSAPELDSILDPAARAFMRAIALVWTESAGRDCEKAWTSARLMAKMKVLSKHETIH